MIITHPIDIVVSPLVLQELLDNLGTGTGVDEQMDVLVQEIIKRAKIFIARFRGSYFLDDEPIHEFVGLEFRDPETSHLLDSARYRLVVRENGFGIFTVEEIPLDDMYDIRLVIAESQQPEFQNDTNESKLPKEDPETPQPGSAS